MNTKPVVYRLPLTKARINLGSVVRRIHLNKEYVVLEKDGIPIAGMMDIDDFEDYLELRDKNLKMQIAEGRAAYGRGEVRDAREFLSEIRDDLQRRKRGRSAKK
jgi:hypothetical protein